MKLKTLIGLTGLLSIFGCSTADYKPGDIFSVSDGKGKFDVVKILVVEPGIIHLRVYKEKFNSRPKNSEVKELSLGRFGDEGGFGLGHLPLDSKGFAAWKPVFLRNEKVEESELDGYKMWKEAP